jgi:hypothetical protein
MKMSGMIERVARAISEQQGVEVDEATDWAAGHWQECVDQAKAALLVLREPTKAMIHAGAEGSGEDSEAVAISAWKAMIDAALKESP